MGKSADVLIKTALSRESFFEFDFNHCFIPLRFGLKATNEKGTGAIFMLRLPEALAEEVWKKSEGAPLAESAFLWRGDKPNSVPVRLPAPVTIISLSPPKRTAARLATHWCDYYPEAARLTPGGTGGPSSLLCLAPHGVFRAPALARRAVGSYPAFSP